MINNLYYLQIYKKVAKTSAFVAFFRPSSNDIKKHGRNSKRIRPCFKQNVTTLFIRRTAYRLQPGSPLSIRPEPVLPVNPVRLH